MSLWMSLNFQNSCSLMMDHIIFFHDHSMILIILILLFVFNLMFYSLKMKYFILFLNENENIEFFWIILPSCMLLFIAMPSLKLLYMMEEFFYSSLNLKAMGFQWYWSYQFMNKKFLNKEMYMFMEKSNIFRLMETSNYLILPINIPIMLLTSSNDVIHSWTIPSLNIKSDSIPGRINQLMIFFNYSSMLIGQCSEICGANHSFMPIHIRTIVF